MKLYSVWFRNRTNEQYGVYWFKFLRDARKETKRLQRDFKLIEIHSFVWEKQY